MFILALLPSVVKYERKFFVMAEKKSDKKSRGWLTVIYPESELSGWREHLSEIGAQALISPLHQFDTNPTGELKKPHYHVILLWDGPTTYSNAKALVDDLGGVGCIPMLTLRGASRYLCHMDNPEKFRYSEDDVVSFGGVDYFAAIASTSDDMGTLSEIYAFLDRNQIFSYRRFILYCMQKRPDWFRFVSTHYRSDIIAFQQSMQWEYDKGLFSAPDSSENWQ